MESRTEQAVALFKEGYNCSQSVFAAYADLLGMDKETALKVSASFGGGIGRMREVCGAANGMFMVAGMLTGATEGKDQLAKKNNYEVVQRLAAEFKKENGGTYICRELLGLDKEGKKVVPGDTTPEARTEEYYKKRPCLKTIEGAAAIVERMLLDGLVEKDACGKEYLKENVNYTEYILEHTSGKNTLEEQGQ
ncbi:MAG: C_GCAxxG_C_C family protein [Lachnospiraceae bacterium]|nr:C_GCAxxG_C_C family protein [Lachnospiraceae bacterium]